MVIIKINAPMNKDIQYIKCVRVNQKTHVTNTIITEAQWATTSVFTKKYNFLIKISDTNSELVVKLIPKKYETNFLLAFGQEDFHKILYI